MDKMAKQLGDVLFSLLALANALNIDIDEQLTVAMRLDAEKYPAKETRAAALRAYQERSAPLFASAAEKVRNTKGSV